MRAATLSIILYVCMAFVFVTTHEAQADRQDLQLNTERDLDNFSFSLMKHIATTYFDHEKKPLIKVAIFRFVDRSGNVTVGSRYITNRIRMAFACSAQFDLLAVHPLEEKFLPSAKVFEGKGELPEGVINDLKSDVYIVGQVKMADRSQVVLQVRAWGVAAASGSYDQLEPLSVDGSELVWKVNLTKTGFRFFRRTIFDQSEQLASSDEEEVVVGRVVFLTQPVNDDLNPWWKTQDGMILARERAETSLTSGSEYGRVMQSRRKTERRTDLDYVIRNFTLMIREKGKRPVQLASYVLPRESEYYFITQKGGTGYRFKYLWFYPGRGTRRVAGNVGKGWNFQLAEADWTIGMPTGVHSCIASLMPASQSLFGTVEPRAEYVIKFKVAVKKGMNVYVVNYVYHRDEPYIFVRRLELEEGEHVGQKGATLTLRQSYNVYGSD